MKVQHHHKEADNLLTQSYKRVLEVVKTPPSRTTWLILVIVLLAVVLIGSWFWFTTSANATNSELWLKKYEGTALGAGQEGSIQARFDQAETARRQLQSIDQLASSDPGAVAQAHKDVENARETYEKLIGESGDSPVLMQESLFGAAKANEALGDVGKARQWYGQLAKDYGSTALGEAAKKRNDALGEAANQKDVDLLKLPSK